MEEKKNIKNHTIMLDNRKTGVLTGVRDVYAFDEDVVLLMTEGGKLQIKGEQLHVKSLDLSEETIEIEGKINGVMYLTKNVKKKNNSGLKQFFR